VNRGRARNIQDTDKTKEDEREKERERERERYCTDYNHEEGDWG